MTTVRIRRLGGRVSPLPRLLHPDVCHLATIVREKNKGRYDEIYYSFRNYSQATEMFMRPGNPRGKLDVLLCQERCLTCISLLLFSNFTSEFPNESNNVK